MTLQTFPSTPRHRVLLARAVRQQLSTARLAPQQELAKTVIARAASRVTGAAVPFSENMRPMSTLKPQRKFSSDELRSGALYFYTNKVMITRRATAMHAYLSMIAALAFKGMSHSALDSLTVNDLRKEYIAPVCNWMSANGMAHDVTRVIPEQDGYTVQVPLFANPISGKTTKGDSGGSAVHNNFEIDGYIPESSNAFALLRLIRNSRVDARGVSTDPEIRNIAQSTVPTLQNRFYSGQEIVSACAQAGAHGLKAARYLEQVKNGGFLVRSVGGYQTVFLQLFFSRAQLEVICQTPWMTVRPVDVYQMMRGWATTRFGFYHKKHSLYSTSLHDIADNLPPGGEPRVSDDLSIMVDHHSQFWYLPREHNGISRFEGESIRYLQRPDGSYSGAPLDENDRMTDIPSSGLILLDWVNLKMTYANEAGRATIMSLDRCVKAHSGHYLFVLRRVPAASDYFKDIFSQVARLYAHVSGAQSAALNEGLLNGLNELLSNAPELSGQRPIDLSLRDLYRYQRYSPTITEFFRAADLIINYSETSMDVLYQRFSFITVSRCLAVLRIMTKISPQYDQIMAQESQRLQPYAARNPDPNYKVPPLPYFRDDVGYQPHQARVMSRLRGSPKFAVLAVDAGGGKTLLGVSDYLKEVALGNVKRGLIMCPPHLVANYVKEFLYFTNGKVNVLAVTTSTLRTHGLEGLQAMIKTAPPNTVVVTDYDLARGNMKALATGYGPSTTRAYPLVDTLRQFRFDYVFCDESHLLKNLMATKSQAVSRLISEIPYKRLASGTLTPNRITDLVAQINLMDPTIFPEGAFENTYSKKVGNKTVWDNAGIMATLQSQVQFIMVKRKEWAAWLPTLKEKQHFVHMTEEQQALYQKILDETVESLKEKALGNEQLARLFGLADATSDDEDLQDGEDQDVEEMADIDALLRPILAYLERFVSAPASHPLSLQILSGKDLVSPKQAKLVDICREHIEQGIPGKILVFCNYLEEASSFYENLPPDLKPKAIHYTAGNKVALTQQFESDDSKHIMIGVEVSMNTGLNLQFASRLIRMSSVWTPGALEQGNSRVLRPNMKTAEKRGHVYIDWIVCENSIDVLKQSYLLSKTVQVALFEEQGNKHYADLQPPPETRLTLDNLKASSYTGSDAILEVTAAYTSMKNAQFKDFAEYRQRNAQDAVVDPVTGRMTPRMVPIVSAAADPDAKLMYRVPYVPGLDLYSAENLGLVRYDIYINSEDLTGDEEEDEKEDASTREKNAAEFAKTGGLGVHTEYGEGTIVGVSSARIRVQLNDGNKVTVRKTAAFVITRAQTNNLDMREAILKEIGEIPFDVPVRRKVVPANDRKFRRPDGVVVPANPADPTTKMREFNLKIIIVNDFPGLQFGAVKTQPFSTKYLEALGFSQPSEFFYAEMKTPAHMLKQFEVWKKKGFHVAPAFSTPCAEAYYAFKTARDRAKTLVGTGGRLGLANFLRETRKPVADRSTLCPYPMVGEDEMMVALPGAGGHPASSRGVAVPAPGVVWKEAPVNNLRQIFFPNLEALSSMIRRILSDGAQIRNIEELREHFSQLQKKSKFLDRS